MYLSAKCILGKKPITLGFAIAASDNEGSHVIVATNGRLILPRPFLTLASSAEKIWIWILCHIYFRKESKQFREEEDIHFSEKNILLGWMERDIFSNIEKILHRDN